MGFQLEKQEDNKKHSSGRWPLGNQLGWILEYFKKKLKKNMYSEKDGICDIKEEWIPYLFSIMHMLKNSANSSKLDD